MAGLSRGSSAESSLKRTKRKAPPPPTSPSAVVAETVPFDENVQGLSSFTFVNFHDHSVGLQGSFYTSRLFHCCFENKILPVL